MGNIRPKPLWLTIATRLFGLILLLTALFFIIEGGKLLSLGGSGYFLISGIVLLVSSIQLFRVRASGAVLYLMFALGTLVWAVMEVGIVFWPLISRLMFPAGLAIVALLLLPSLRQPQATRSVTVVSYFLALVTTVGFVAAFAGMFQPHDPVAFQGQPKPIVPVSKQAPLTNWDNYGNTPGGSRFVAADQITRENIQHLKPVWTFHTGDIPLSPDGNGAEDQQTPLQVGDKIFLCTPHNNVIAVDADSGKALWKAEINAKSSVWMRCRGLAYFDATKSLPQADLPGSSQPLAIDSGNVANCPRRILMNTIDGRLIALNADNGQFCEGFGDHGTVNLLTGMGNAPDPQYVLTSAPTLAGTTVVVGGRISDNVSTDMPGGVLRGFDVLTGALRWAFDPGNPNPNATLQPGQSYVRSTPNSWAPMSYDPQSNTVFMPMGSSSVDIWGANRTPLDHKYGASILAVDANTGKEKWVYQTVHNDLWDFDIPMQPSLIDFKTPAGEDRPAVVVGTKAGQIYVLDRQTGKPLTKVENVKVKRGNIPGEQYSDTQPRSVGMPQIGAQTLKESDMWGATPFDQLICRVNFKSMRYDGLYTAPGTDKSLSFPGSLGGMNWGSLSTDPNNHLIFVNDMRLGLWQQLIKADPNASTAANTGGEAVNTGMGAVPMKGAPYSVNKNRFMSPLGIPCQAPPFGTLSAIDMTTQKILWQVPLGTVQDTGPMGIKMGMKMPIGMPSLGGSLATQGGLIFIAGTQDYYLRAFDSSTGKEVWKARLPVGSQGGPISYVSPKTGKQYILISAGGARQSPDRGDYVIAYALN